MYGEPGVAMFLAIVGGVLVGGVGLAALYDYIAKRHGKNVSVSGAGPMMRVIDSTRLHEDGWTEGPVTAAEVERDL
jgi:hypothetical protein